MEIKPERWSLVDLGDGEDLLSPDNTNVYVGYDRLRTLVYTMKFGQKLYFRSIPLCRHVVERYSSTVGRNILAYDYSGVGVLAVKWFEDLMKVVRERSDLELAEDIYKALSKA